MMGKILGGNASPLEEQFNHRCYPQYIHHSHQWHCCLLSTWHNLSKFIRPLFQDTKPLHSSQL